MLRRRFGATRSIRRLLAEPVTSLLHLHQTGVSSAAAENLPDEFPTELLRGAWAGSILWTAALSALVANATSANASISLSLLLIELAVTIAAPPAWL